MNKKCPIYTLILLLFISNLACSKSSGVSSYQFKDKVAINQSNPYKVIVGRASWYGHPFHGRRTANGETYNMYEMTAAHKTLPFGSLLQVTNLKNNKVLTVRVNDRGPYIEGRDVDLSFAAAEKLDMVGTGVAKVKIEVFKPWQVLPRVAVNFKSVHRY